MKTYAAVVCLLALSSIMSGTAAGQWFGTPGGPWNFPQMSMFPYTALPPPQPLLYPPSYYANPGSSYYYAAPYGSTPAYWPDDTSSNDAVSAADASTSVAAISAPPAATSAAAPKAAGDASFVLVNPRRNGRSIRYSLNQFTYIMRPGESQTVPLNGDWVITFTGARNKTIKYRMEPGRYEFIDSPDSGWNLFRHVPAAPVAPDDVPPSP